MITFIYTLNEPENPEIVRYVGQSVNIKRRYRDHLKGNKNRNTHTTNWIQGLINKNLKPILNIIDECDVLNLDKVEQGYIKLYKSYGCNLTNHSIGGHSSLGCKHSKESKLKRSIRQTGRKLIFSKEGREAVISAAIKMLKERPELRIDNLLSKEERYKAALKGNKIASEKLKKKIIYKSEKEEKIYEGSREAMEDLKIPRSTISHICLGNTKQRKEFTLNFYK
jgi:group I intron endonuclease